MSSAFVVIVCVMCVQERLLSSWELVWHLCEVLYLESLPPGCLVLQLLEWIKWHSTHADQLLSQVTNVWDAHQDYWTTVSLQLGSPLAAVAIAVQIWFIKHASVT